MVATQIFVLIILLFLSALFSGIETALMSINQIKVQSLVKQGKRGAAVLHRIKQRPHRLIITILIGNNLVNIGATSLATVMFTELFGSSGIGIATGVMTFVVLVFGEITPKTFASQNAERISLIVARPIEVLSIVLAPLVWFFGKISKTMSNLLGSQEEETLSEAELETIVTMGRKEGLLEKEAAEMMHNILKFGGTTVKEIMTPHAEMVMIDGNRQLGEVLDLIVKTPYSRYPVTTKGHHIEGIVDIDDVLKCVRDKKLGKKVRTLARPILFVPESKEIDDLLIEFEGKEAPMAVVVDEYGGIEGLVTAEDILEEIVGDIFDKSKTKNNYFKKLDEKVIRVDAKVPIDELNRILKLGLRSDQCNTVAGYIQHRLKRIPFSGERIKLRNAVIEIGDVTNQRIKNVKIIKP